MGEGMHGDTHVQTGAHIKRRERERERERDKVDKDRGWAGTKAQGSNTLAFKYACTN